MICKQCGAVLPDESHFCPYCMTKLGADGIKTKDRNTKRIVVAITIALLIAALAASAVVFEHKNKSNHYSDASDTNIYQKQSESPPSESEKVTAEIEGRYYEPGTYFYNIDGEGEIVLETFDYYPF